jgi:hypothetical protein
VRRPVLGRALFGGISTRVKSTATRAVVLGLGCLVLLGALAWITTFPISISV